MKKRKPKIGMVNYELSVKQLRNIETNVKGGDTRTVLRWILEYCHVCPDCQCQDQVELAQYKYMLPRLQRLWTHLERQGGGSEPEVEGFGWGFADRVKPSWKWTAVSFRTVWPAKQRLAEIDRQKSTQRKNRGCLISCRFGGIYQCGKSTMELMAKK